MSDDKAGAIGLAIQQVGGLVVEYMRAKAAREVVTASHDTILQLVDLVQRDFDPKADHWSLGYDVVVTALVGAAEFAAVGPDAAIRAPSGRRSQSGGGAEPGPIFHCGCACGRFGSGASRSANQPALCAAIVGCDARGHQ